MTVFDCKAMPSGRLTIIVRLEQAVFLDRLEHFREVRKTLIGTDVSVLPGADDGPAATQLFSDLGALAIPFEAHATIGDVHTWSPATGTRSASRKRGHRHRRVWAIHLDEPMAPWTRTTCGSTMALWFPGPGP
jgi:hypothetical protein